jgi:hypothetical protein
MDATSISIPTPTCRRTAAFDARAATLRLPATWPWAEDIAAACGRLKALPAPG